MVDRSLDILYYKKFGYCIDMVDSYDRERNHFYVSEDPYCHYKDKEWIMFLGCDKNYYIDTLINKFNAYQNATKEYPRLFFKKKEDAQRALEEFYEPALLLFTMSQNY